MTWDHRRIRKQRGLGPEAAEPQGFEPALQDTMATPLYLLTNHARMICETLRVPYLIEVNEYPDYDYASNRHRIVFTFDFPWSSSTTDIVSVVDVMTMRRKESVEAYLHEIICDVRNKVRDIMEREYPISHPPRRSPDPALQAKKSARKGGRVFHLEGEKE